MEEKINNQKVFNYIPSLLMKLILENPLKDKDVFCDSSQNKLFQNQSSNNNNNSIKTNSLFIYPNIYPIKNELPSSLLMIIKLGGFKKLISTLVLKDQKNQKEKLISEYLSIITPRILLKISSIISENGGEIIKYNDFELIVIWINNNNNKNSKYYSLYNKFNAKLGLITATELMKKVDKTEITNGVKLELSIGISFGDVSCVFFGGERKRAEYVFLGNGFDNAQKCLLNCLPHEIIIDKELDEIFQSGEIINTINIDEKKLFYSLLGYNEENLKDFKNFKGIKLRNTNLCINKAFYENLESKMHITLSIMPSGLIKYLDMGVETNSQEIYILTVETIVVHFENEINKDLKEMQNIIFDIQKSIYLAFGILIHISKTDSGFLIRCIWGVDPSSFIDDTARAISTASVIGNLTKYYNIKLGIGIATGACYSGLISLQGNKKVYTLLGKKVILSRLLAEEACKNAVNDNNIKYIIYCDKPTMNYSQKWYRHIFVSQLKIYLTKKDEIFEKYKIEFYDGRVEKKLIKQIQLDKNKPLEHLNMDQNNLMLIDKEDSKLKNEKLDINQKQYLIDNEAELEAKNDEEYKQMKKKICIENEYYLINEVYSPIEDEEYFIPSYYDPFPLIRTHLNNSYSPKNKLYFKNILQITNNEDIYQSKISKIRNHSMSKVSIHQAESHTKMMLKLKKSQTIFGHSIFVKKFYNIMNHVYKNKKRQFFIINGPFGIGKTLFVKKCLNNFIGSNDFISGNYFTGDQFLFCNIVKPLNKVLPFNTISYILREIFLNIKKINKLAELYNNFMKLNLSDNSLKNISFILSVGKNDINLDDEFSKLSNKYKMDVILEKEDNKIVYEKRKTAKVTKEKSYVKYLEGPFNFEDKYMLYNFFLDMIILYKTYLNNENNESNKIPLIFVIDDLQYSDIYSIEFIQYLFNENKEELNPFFVILIEQTPFNKNFSPLASRILENFLIFITEYSDKPKEDKIIRFDMKPLIEKYELQNLIIFYNKEAIMKKYKTNLESVDEQILDFLLMKTFNGIPLLALSLFDALIKSEKFIQKLSGEFIITSELIDDNIIQDWSDLLLPYIYEKIDSMIINTLLSYKEIILIKYASIIGNIFDLNTLEKLNPLKNLIKIKEIEKILLKLNNEYLLEIYYQEIEKNTNKIQNIVCQLTLPLLREILHQKFPMERRAILHMKVAKYLSTSKRNIYFSIENELKIFKRHLLYSEMNIINEIESKDIKTVQDILQNKMELNYNNLKLYVVKEIFSKYYSEYEGNIMEGNLEILFNNKWLKISYFIDIEANININWQNPKKMTDEIIMMIPIKSIYKNKILSQNQAKMKSNNMLAVYQSLGSEPLLQNNKKMILFSSEQREEICKLDIAINFLKIKVNYDKYVFQFGKMHFPLYKIKWYKQKSLLLYSHLEQNGISIQQHINSNKFINSNNLNYSESYKSDILNDTKNSFNLIFKSTLSIFLGRIQEHLCKMNTKKQNINFNDINYSYDFLTPKHLKKKINIFLKSSIKRISKEMIKQSNLYFRNSISTYSSFKSNYNSTKQNDNYFDEDEEEILNKKDKKKKELQEIKEENKEINEEKKEIKVKNKEIKEENKEISEEKKEIKVKNKEKKEENKEINEQNKEIKEGNKEIKEVNEKIKEENEKIKKKKTKRKERKSKNNSTINHNNTKLVFDKNIEKPILLENLKIDDNNLKINDNKNNIELIKEKKEEFDDLNIDEFDFEEDSPINISINNMKKTFNSSYYITTTETNHE